MQVLGAGGGGGLAWGREGSRKTRNKERQELKRMEYEFYSAQVDHLPNKLHKNVLD